MSEPTAAPAAVQTTAEDVVTDAPRAEEDLVMDDLIVEDVSIDGMCGVY